MVEGMTVSISNEEEFLQLAKDKEWKKIMEKTEDERDYRETGEIGESPQLTAHSLKFTAQSSQLNADRFLAVEGNVFFSFLPA